MANDAVLRLDVNKEQLIDKEECLAMILTHDKKDLISGFTSVKFKPIGERAVQLAKSMIDANQTVLTKYMRNHVGYKIEGNQLFLYDTASYSSYIEYGFDHRSAGFVGPWPFLRPAINMVAAESKGELGEEFAKGLKEVLETNSLNAVMGSKLYFNNRLNNMSIFSRNAKDNAERFRMAYGEYPRGPKEKGESNRTRNRISEYEDL